MSSKFPHWADSPEDVIDCITTANGLHANIPRESSEGPSIHIGVIDSAYALPEEYTSGYNVIESKSNAFVTKDKPYTTSHCLRVFNQLKTYTPFAKFTLYQAVNSDEKAPVAPFSDAITAAINGNVDILNISCGDPWRGPIRSNPLLIETKRAIDEGISVVAGAGNWKVLEETKPPVHCPAALEPVIAVGGLEVRCPVEPGDEPAGQNSDSSGPYYVIDKERAGEYQPYNKSFCGATGCINGQGCIPNQEEHPWNRNPLPTGSKPDVLAPMHMLECYPNSTVEWCLATGTSFSAPIVTASLSNIFSELKMSGKEIPLPHEVREAVRSGSTRIDNGGIPKYNAIGTRKALNIA